jgi:hypothetical protein
VQIASDLQKYVPAKLKTGATLSLETVVDPVTQSRKVEASGELNIAGNGGGVEIGSGHVRDHNGAKVGSYSGNSIIVNTTVASGKLHLGGRQDADGGNVAIGVEAQVWGKNKVGGEVVIVRRGNSTRVVPGGYADTWLGKFGERTDVSKPIEIKPTNTTPPP